MPAIFSASLVLDAAARPHAGRTATPKLIRLDRSSQHQGVGRGDAATNGDESHGVA